MTAQRAFAPIRHAGTGGPSARSFFSGLPLYRLIEGSPGHAEGCEDDTPARRGTALEESTLSTATLTRPTQAGPAPVPVAPVSAPAQAAAAPSAFGAYLGYVGYFVGAGLISGGIVHYPLDAARYGKIGAAGVALFVAATVLNEIVLPRKRPDGATIARLVAASLLLSLGIGMLSGGIQHFMDFPGRAATLIPAGLVLSFVAYAVKNGPTTLASIFGHAGAAVAAIAFASLVGLSQFAAVVEASGAGGHGHGHSAVTAQQSASPAGKQGAHDKAAKRAGTADAKAAAGHEAEDTHGADGH